MSKSQLARENESLRDALEQARFRVVELDEIVSEALGLDEDEDNADESCSEGEDDDDEDGDGDYDE